MDNTKFHEKKIMKMKPIVESNNIYECKMCSKIKQYIFQCHTCNSIYCDQCWDICSHCIHCKWKLNKNMIIDKIPKQTCSSTFRKIIKCICFL